MVNWQSPAEIAKDAAAFGKFMHVLLGLYIWEWFTSLEFDWSYVSGQRRFRWPMIFYFLNRYCLLFALIGITVSLNVTAEIDCQGLYTFNAIFGNAAIGLASINLSLRTIAVWNQRWYIWLPLLAIIMGHWSLLLHGVLINAAWDPVQGCVITSTDNRLLAATFIYGMSFDFTVLCLTAYKLAFPAGGKSRLITLIFRDGLIYFVIAFLSNLLATIFMLLDLNAVMSIIANVPAAIASTVRPFLVLVPLILIYLAKIVACRAVRRLANYSTTGAEMFTGATTAGSTLAFRTTGATVRPKVLTKASDGVHIQMETFESPSETVHLEYDVAGKITKSEAYDPEAQAIRNEFKRPPY
ncbi:hypothetical protein MSAN_01574600 [Mycena sanguinolenta]|uniref:Transmembrane protein n=1 Tax=Mycena sanguinolenta TaxID=230812 RepID=A0A8H6Y3S2_9AGAR|nr:hypothetical protein MSAN_01574600 [Mycena sanguinolenta]